MARYKSAPEAQVRLDAEAGRDAAWMTKSSHYRDAETYDDRARERSSARGLDRMVEDGNFTRARKDLERAYPRSAVRAVNPRKRRTLPIPDAIRLPPSSRQRKARSVAKHRAQSNLPRVQYKAMSTLITDPQTWIDVGETLTEVGGDAQLLDKKGRAYVQRIDRAIQAAERENDRGHVVYCAVSLPHEIPEEPNAMPSTLLPGARVEFDRFTMTSHAIHELDEVIGEREVIFEMETSRGMYLGQSDSGDDTAHLLPRGMQWDVVGSHDGRYRKPDGTYGRCRIVQLRDVGEEGS
ncbi:hypothetical protein [Rhodococcus pyridinivorans]|uniref:hypothetical protein n=1 Tax=Rhodococcus pyridinivorans TaxID=103816 RepID=UPI0026582114|nr:hypothetical protein [Rhodococcus pyridinivorans]